MSVPVAPPRCKRTQSPHYLDGDDHACGGALLDGLRQWLADTRRVGSNLVWFAQVVLIVFPGGRPAEPWSEDEHRQAVAGLFALLEEFFEHLASRGDAISGTAGGARGGVARA
ncbi:hypothetical protein [Streptomyces sp. MST-110588]|uniref:hypothetical protein n=1 Tax=Streptomyces sp. MST-110588 TaxID=2833628 RepID=UPI001F5C7396|nr:hypothetical protein [Streptomyces sp. MST-110588]UNO40303.1 hypothetical protein KGS77_12830 [Streptomyces sp. MST-110588]